MIVNLRRELDATKTAVILIDVWDHHWSVDAERRINELAPAINRFAQTVRSQGVLIIHAPSDTMNFYIDHPARKNVVNLGHIPRTSMSQYQFAPLPSASQEVPLDVWGNDKLASEEVLAQVWTREHPEIGIAETDVISDDGSEIWKLVYMRGIRNILLAGVHLNACMLYRSFGIRQWVRRKWNVMLVRDLTDVIYNPRYFNLSHRQALQAMVSYVENNLCPSLDSGSLTGHPGFVFGEDHE